MCLQVIEDFVDFEANCSKSYEILLKCITDSIDVEGNDKQSNEEVSMEDIEPSDCIDHDHAEVPEIVADDEQIAESLHLTVDEERNIQALQIITDKREESNTRSAKVSTKRNFSDRTSLRVHEARHSATKSFQCDHCDRAYYSQIELNQHCLAKHEGSRIRTQIGSAIRLLHVW
uniref:C2H2-type domain-containing protein n=1 Tax=Anopheles christyi TaxID=43041 RepID=A0A182K801_9DIPT